MGWFAWSTFFPETHGYKTIRIKICIKKIRILWALSWPTISHGTVKPVGLSANCYPGALWMRRAFNDSVTKEKGNCYWQDLSRLWEGLWLQTSLDSIKYTHGSYTDKSVIYFIPTSGGGCQYKWNPVGSALCRFCPGSFLPNLVGRFGLIFSKSPCVRYDRSKKNVTLTPILPCLIGLSSSVEPNCIFTTPTPTPPIPTNNIPPLYCLYP